MPDQPTQSQLDTEALARTLRIGRQMAMITDALFSGGKLSKQPTNTSGFPEGWDRDDSKEGMFRDHRCVVCDDGRRECPDGQTGPHRNCGNPHARDD